MTGLLAGLVVLAFIILALVLREVLTVLLARAPAQVRVLSLGQQAPGCNDAIPKILWTYWQTTPPPAFVAACLANWQRFAPDHELRLLDRHTLAAWLPSLRADFDTLPAFRQADWLRIQLLARHGGIWLDASTLLSRDLAWLHEARARHGAEYVGFYIDRYSTRPELPIVENWCMASVPGGGFVTTLAAAFDRALDTGAEALLQRLQAEGRHAQVVQGLTEDFQRYLLMHVAAADLLDRTPQAWRLALLRAEDGPFAWLAGVGWRKRHLYARLALTPCPTGVPALLKLRGGDRAVTERHWLRGRVLQSSALARLLGPAP